MPQQFQTNLVRRSAYSANRVPATPLSSKKNTLGLLPTPVLQLQQKLGNRRVAQLIRANRLTPQGKIIGIQRKVTVSAANDQYEQEADNVARRVIGMPDGIAENSMQRGISPEEDKDNLVQTKPLRAPITPFIQSELESHGKGKSKSE